MREHLVRQAIRSYQDLQTVVNELTAKELYKVLELESSTNRRASIIKRVIRRLVWLRESNFRLRLMRRFLSGTNELKRFERNIQKGDASGR